VSTRAVSCNYLVSVDRRCGLPLTSPLDVSCLLTAQVALARSATNSGTERNGGSAGRDARDTYTSCGRPRWPRDRDVARSDPREPGGGDHREAPQRGQRGLIAGTPSDEQPRAAAPMLATSRDGGKPAETWTRGGHEPEHSSPHRGSGCHGLVDAAAEPRGDGPSLVSLWRRLL
jgi:hypothetical protein